MNGYVIPFINFHYPFFSSCSSEENGYFTLLDLVFFPLINTLERLEDDGIDYSLSMSFSTSFIHLLANNSINERYIERTRSLQAEETRDERKDTWRDILVWMDRYQKQPLIALKRLAAYGHLEIITGTATNAPLPLLAPVPEAVKAQISVALAVYKQFLGNECKGICLNPSCCYQQLPQQIKNAGVDYIVVAPLSSPRKMEISQPIITDTNLGIGMLVANSSLSLNFCECLTGEWQKADESANVFMEILRSYLNHDDKTMVIVIYADAWQLIEEKRNKKINTCFLELLLRKICCDQKEIELDTPASYLANATDFIDFNDWSSLSQNLTQFYQAGYQQLFPDLHIAALKLLKLKNKKGSTHKKSKLIKELLLAQSGDHNPNNDSFCRDHLQRFTAVIQSLEGITINDIVSETTDDDGFLSSIDLSLFY